MCKTGGLILTIYTPYVVYLRNPVRFWGRGEATVHLVVKSPNPYLGHE